MHIKWLSASCFVRKKNAFDMELVYANGAVDSRTLQHNSTAEAKTLHGLSRKYCQQTSPVFKVF